MCYATMKNGGRTVARQAAGNRNTTFGRKRSEGIHTKKKKRKKKYGKNQKEKNANILFVAIDKNHADSSVGAPRPHLQRQVRGGRQRRRPGGQRKRRDGKGGKIEKKKRNDIIQLGLLVLFFFFFFLLLGIGLLLLPPADTPGESRPVTNRMNEKMTINQRGEHGKRHARTNNIKGASMNGHLILCLGSNFVSI